MKDNLTPVQAKVQEIKENQKKIFTHDWIFGSVFEKLLIIAMFLWALFSIGRWIWGIFT